MSNANMKHLTNVFDKNSMEEVPGRPIESRSKRPHFKSRLGCDNCKKRRVKCDENYPSCNRCLKRGDTCSGSWRERHVSRRHSIKSPASSPSLSLVPLPTTTKESAINLEDINLFHHFQTSTYSTLPLLSPVWKDAVELAFRYEYLMHAVLCISASHIAFLSQNTSQNKHYKIQSRKHLSCALRLFREALGKAVIDDDSDAILATSALIYYEAWSSPDALATDAPVENTDAGILYRAPDDQLLALASGMRHLFSSNKWGPLYNISIFSRTIAHRPIKAIESATLSLGRDPLKLECHLAGFYNQPDKISDCHVRQLPDQTISAKTQLRKHNYSDIQLAPLNFPSCAYDSYMSVAARLSILLSLLPGKEENATISIEKNTFSSALDIQPELLYDVARVVYTFSLLFHESFLNMIHDNDSRALLLLYYFYRMIDHLLPKQDCWWASTRAEVMQQRLARRLWG